MSALGQKRTCAPHQSMSALPPKATSNATIECPLRANSEHNRTLVSNHAARSTRVSISPRSIPKSIGLVKSASAPPSNALRSVSASP